MYKQKWNYGESRGFKVIIRIVKHGCEVITKLISLFTDPRDVENAARKLSTLTMVVTILGFLLIVTGVITLVYAGENPGFPIFNIGPLLTGLIVSS